MYELKDADGALLPGSKALRLGSILEESGGDEVNSFKLIFTTYENHDDIFNDVHFYRQGQPDEPTETGTGTEQPLSAPTEMTASSQWRVFENRNLFRAGDPQSGIGINAKIEFTSLGTNLIFIDDTVDPPVMNVFV